MASKTVLAISFPNCERPSWRELRSGESKLASNVRTFSVYISQREFSSVKYSSASGGYSSSCAPIKGKIVFRPLSAT